MQKSVTVISCKYSYRENIKENYHTYNSLEEASKEIFDSTNCTFEVLQNDERRIYLDIEKIDDTDTDDKIVNGLIQKIMEYYKINDKDNYVLTKNVKSNQHKGLSYHLILPYKINADDLMKSLVAFTMDNPEYSSFIDIGVYGKVRLFRLPDNCKMRPNGLDPEDVHKIVHGKFEDSIIQDVNDVLSIDLSHLRDRIDRVTGNEIRDAKKKCYLNNMSPDKEQRLTERIEKIEKMLEALMSKLNVAIE